MKGQVDDLKKAFASAGIELNTTLVKGMTNAALIVEADYKKRLTTGGQVASGLLRASASHRIIDNGGYPVAQIGPAVEYGKEVELGGPPRLVPFETILQWVVRKGIAGRSGKGGRRTKADRSNEEEIAFLIQRSIQEKGTMPHPALLPALVSNRAAILNAIAAPLKAKLAGSGAKHAS
jgi:hypothetical protein